MKLIHIQYAKTPTNRMMMEYLQTYISLSRPSSLVESCLPFVLGEMGYVTQLYMSLSLAMSELPLKTTYIAAACAAMNHILSAIG